MLEFKNTFLAFIFYQVLSLDTQLEIRTRIQEKIIRALVRSMLI